MTNEHVSRETPPAPPAPAAARGVFSDRLEFAERYAELLASQGVIRGLIGPREALGLDQVEVVRARAEERHGRRRFDVVTSRAVAPLPKLARWSLPLTRPGGTVVAMKGASARAEVDDARRELRKLGAGPVSVHTVGVGVVDPPTYAVRVEAPPTRD